MKKECRVCKTEFIVDEGILEAIRKGPERISLGEGYADEVREEAAICPNCGTSHPLDRESLMHKCQWNDCPNDGTNHRYKPAEAKHDKKERLGTARSIHQIYVCDSHLEQAKEEYPYDVSEEAL